MNTEKISPRLTAKIVKSYVRHHTVAAGQLSDLIVTVHRAIGQVKGIAGTLIEMPRRTVDRPDRDRLALRFGEFKKSA